MCANFLLAFCFLFFLVASIIQGWGVSSLFLFLNNGRIRPADAAQRPFLGSTRLTTYPGFLRIPLARLYPPSINISAQRTLSRNGFLIRRWQSLDQETRVFVPSEILQFYFIFKVM